MSIRGRKEEHQRAAPPSWRHWQVFCSLSCRRIIGLLPPMDRFDGVIESISDCSDLVHRVENVPRGERREESGFSFLENRDGILPRH